MAASIKSRLGLFVRLSNSVLMSPRNYLVIDVLYFIEVYAGYVKLSSLTGRVKRGSYM